ncbi:HAMP domain-containing histidine kinase [Candidatus Uhrbacteria bacterium]|nr:HAMP domain-containing histidine kinase [Candidatus Uhrbacteria bacterium]
MNTKAKVQLTAAFSILLAIGIGAMLFFAARQQKEASVKRSITDGVIREVSALNVITYNFLLDPTVAERTRWILKHESIGAFLRSAVFNASSEQIVLYDLKEGHQGLKAIFTQLTGEPDLARRNQLLGQLLAETRTMVADAFRLAKGVEREEAAILHRSGALIIIALIVITGSMMGFAVFLLMNLAKWQEAKRARNEFIALATHRIRTPLSAAKWYTEVLLAGDAGPLRRAQRDYLEKIEYSNERLIALVNDLLITARIEISTLIMQSEPLQVQEIASQVIHALTLAIKEKKLKIEERYSRAAPMVEFDPEFLRIIFHHLLGNAVKYTPPGGKITLAISFKKGAVVIAVSDTGLGIPQDQQARVFTKLFRADNVRKADPDGVGLGLYIVKAIVDRAGGSIRFESKEREGTTFYVTLPVAGGQY